MDHHHWINRVIDSAGRQQYYTYLDPCFHSCRPGAWSGFLISLTFCFSAVADIKDASYAVPMFKFMRTLGMCFGIAVGGTVFQNRLYTHLEEADLPVDAARNATAIASTLKDLPADSGENTAYILAYSQSFRDLFKVLTVIAVLGGIVFGVHCECSLGQIPGIKSCKEGP